MLVISANDLKLKSYLKLLNLLLLLFVWLAYFASIYFNFNITGFLKYYLIIGFVFVLLTAKIYYPWSHSYILFLAGFGLFLISRVFLDVLGLVDIGFANKWKYYFISASTINKVLLLFIVSLFSINFGTLQKFNNKTHILNRNLEFKYPRSLKVLIVVIIILLIPGTFYKLLFDLEQSYKLGYESVYMSNRIPAPFLCRLSWFLIKSVVPLYLLIIPTKRQFLVFVFLIFFINFSWILEGNRSELVAPLAFFFWYYYKYYSTKVIRFRAIVIISLVLIIFSSIALSLRERQKVERFSLPYYTYMFLNGQGVTYMTCVYYFDYKDKMLNPSRFAVFNGINNYFLRSKVEVSHNLEYVKKTISLDHKLTYAVNPEIYLEGKGLGTSFLIELLALGGWLALMIGSYFLGVLITYFENIFLINQYSIFFSWFWIVQLIQMPRAELLPDMVPLLLSIIILISLMGVIIVYNKIKQVKL